jgi:hypothetical protein
MKWDAPVVSCETQAMTSVVAHFRYPLPIPLTDNFDPVTRTKRHPEVPATRGDRRTKRRGNDDDEEGEMDTEEGKG